MHYLQSISLPVERIHVNEVTISQEQLLWESDFCAELLTLRRYFMDISKSMKETISSQKLSPKPGMDPNQSVKCKIVVVGDSQCGKTALLHVFAKDCFPEVGYVGCYCLYYVLDTKLSYLGCERSAQTCLVCLSSTHLDNVHVRLDNNVQMLSFSCRIMFPRCLRTTQPVLKSTRKE